MPEFLKRTKEELSWVALAITLCLGVIGLSTLAGVSPIEALTFFGIFVLMVMMKNGFKETTSKLEMILDILKSIQRQLQQSSGTRDPPFDEKERRKEEKREGEPIKTTGFGAFGGMLLGGAIGLVFGTLGVLIGGVLGAIIGDELERESIKAERKKKREKAAIY